MPRKKQEEPTLKDDETYYVSVRDLPFDVLRQRINQASGADRRAARKELLLKMGAKPEKKVCVNYRVLMEEKKQAKLIAIADYRNERFKMTTLERQTGRHIKNKKQIRKARRKGGGGDNKKSGTSRGVKRISKSLAKKIRKGK